MIFIWGGLALTHDIMDEPNLPICTKYSTFIYRKSGPSIYIYIIWALDILIKHR
jgi:hypothetical protein